MIKGYSANCVTICYSNVEGRSRGMVHSSHLPHRPLSPYSTDYDSWVQQLSVVSVWGWNFSRQTWPEDRLDNLLLSVGGTSETASDSHPDLCYESCLPNEERPLINGENQELQIEVWRGLLRPYNTRCFGSCPLLSMHYKLRGYLLKYELMANVEKQLSQFEASQAEQFLRRFQCCLLPQVTPFLPHASAFGHKKLVVIIQHN